MGNPPEGSLHPPRRARAWVFHQVFRDPGSPPPGLTAPQGAPLGAPLKMAAPKRVFAPPRRVRPWVFHQVFCLARRPRTQSPDGGLGTGSSYPPPRSEGLVLPGLYSPCGRSGRSFPRRMPHLPPLHRSASCAVVFASQKVALRPLPSHPQSR